MEFILASMARSAERNNESLQRSIERKSPLTVVLAVKWDWDVAQLGGGMAVNTIMNGARPVGEKPSRSRECPTSYSPIRPNAWNNAATECIFSSHRTARVG